MSLAKKIHFASLIGIDVDFDMLPYWIPHYKSLKLDSYTAYLHLSLDEDKNENAKDFLFANNFNFHSLPNDCMETVSTMKGSPDTVRKNVLDSFVSNIPKEEFVLIADSDEIQMWNRLPHEELDRGITVVVGDFIDCFDETLHAPDPRLTLKQNYPMTHINLTSLIKDDWYVRRKQCMHPAKYPVNLSASHYVYMGKDWTGKGEVITGPIDILHYRWREGAIKRVEGRPYWSEKEISKMKVFFGVDE